MEKLLVFLKIIHGQKKVDAAKGSIVKTSVAVFTIRRDIKPANNIFIFILR